MGFFSFFSDLSEGMKHETKINFFVLKFFKDFSEKYEVEELRYDGCHSWEEYDEKLLKIKVLDISNKRLLFMDSEIENIAHKLTLFLNDANIEVLLLRGNEINKIPNSFIVENVDTLRVLDLSNNQISEIPEDFQLPCGLKTLDLSSNYIDDLPFNYRFHSNLETLNLSRNQFRNFKYGYSGHVSDTVKNLDLSHNQLTWFYTKDVENLTSLKLNNNKIHTKFPLELKEILEKKNSSFENNPIFNTIEPYEDGRTYSQNTYINRCFNCGAGIDSRKNEHCDNCNFYKCGSCGSCFCNN